MAVWVTGDIHGNPVRLSTDNFPEQKGMTKEDHVLILGDFGLVWDKERESREEAYWLDWLEGKPFTTLFIDGNHENFDRLDAYPVTQWHGGKVHKIRPSVLHLMRGQVFEIEGRSFFAFGGASSHDISAGILDPGDPDFKRKKKKLDADPSACYRIRHVSWWERELPSREEMEEGLRNLSAWGNKVDFVLTHCTYNALLSQLDGGSGLYRRDALSDYLQQVKETTDCRQWIFGHFHINQAFYWEKAVCIYEQITRIL